VVRISGDKIKGFDLKVRVRLATTGNVTLSSAPATIDSVSPSNGDRILVWKQTTGSENGIYDYNGSGSAMTRSSDFMEDSDADDGAFFYVEEGSSYAGRMVRLHTQNPTIGTTSLDFRIYPDIGDAQLTLAAQVFG